MTWDGSSPQMWWRSLAEVWLRLKEGMHDATRSIQCRVGGFGGEELIATRDTHVTEEERARGFSGGSRETKGAKKSGPNRVNGKR